MEAITQLLLIVAPLSAFFLALALITEIVERRSALARARPRRARRHSDPTHKRGRSPRPRRRMSEKTSDQAVSTAP